MHFRSRMTPSRQVLRETLYRQLSQRALGKVLLTLSKLPAGQQNERLDELRSTYRTLLNYHFEGTADPNQEDVMTHLLRQSWELTDELLLAQSARPFSEHPVFNPLWEPNHYKEEQQAFLRKLLNDPTGDNNAQLAVSAVTLSCLYVFDEAKMLCLVEACSAEDPTVRLRALTGLLICLMVHARRIELYPSITNGLQLLFDDVRHIRDAQTVLRQLVVCLETEKISKDLHDNILPILTQTAREMQEKPKPAANDEEEEEIEFLEHWDEVLHKSGLERKMQDFAQLKMEGYDVNYSSFYRLKSFAFFQRLENWFMPFDPDCPDIREGVQTLHENFPQVVDALMTNGFMCDSDKYSFFLSLAQMPAEYRQNAGLQLKIDSSQSHDREMTDSASFINLYLQDLYRFFKLYPSRNEFTDVFALPPDINHLPFFRHINPENVFLPEWGQRLIKAGQYAAALTALLKQASSDDGSATVYQKIGYCYQKTEAWQLAIDNYAKADIIEPDQDWTQLKMAQCHRQLGQNEQAAKLYTQLSHRHPDQPRYIEPLAICWCALGRFDAAKKLFEKMEYLWPNRKKSDDYRFNYGLVLWQADERKPALEQWKTLPVEELENALRQAASAFPPQEISLICDYFSL